MKLRVPYRLRPLLVIGLLSIVGFGAGVFTGRIEWLWVAVSVAFIFSAEKWWRHYTGRYKMIGRGYRLVLNLIVLLTLSYIIWFGIQLFGGSTMVSPLTGSLLLAGGLLFIVWVCRVVRKNKWRQPSFKLTTISVVVLLSIFTFAGVEPLSTYKDIVLDKWGTYQTEQQMKAQAREVARLEAETVARLEAEESAKAQALETSNMELLEPEAVVTIPSEGISSNLCNPTWAELKSFLASDDTDKQLYIYPIFVCADFANRLQRNANEAGWRCAVVWLAMSGYSDPYNYGIAPDAGHACNAFETTDRGLVYIDCTGLSSNYGPTHNDRIVDVQIGQEYNPKHIFPTSWYIPRGQMGIVEQIESIRW